MTSKIVFAEVDLSTAIPEDVVFNVIDIAERSETRETTSTRKERFIQVNNA